MSCSAEKEIKALIRDCEARGLIYSRGRKKGKITNPLTGKSISISLTPSCRWAATHVKQDVRKYLGVEID